MKTTFHSGRRLRNYRKFQAYSQEQLASILGVDVTTLRRWERNGLPRSQIRYVAETLGIPTEILWAKDMEEKQFERFLLNPETFADVIAGAFRPSDKSDEFLDIPKLTWADWKPPAAILRAEYGVVPFHGRESEIEDLMEWALNPTEVKFRLYTGAGGMGKTRLALEICTYLKKEGWVTGFATPKSDDEKRWRELFSQSDATLIVIDYAETRCEMLHDIISALMNVKSTHLRIILLARAAGDWWEKAKGEHGGLGDFLCGPATEWYTLKPLAMTLAERRNAFETALTHIGQQLERPIPSTYRLDFEDPCYDRILMLHMQAMALLDGIRVKGEQGLLDYVLRRERRYWEEMARRRGLRETMDIGIGRGMAAITLGGGVANENEALKILRDLMFFRDQTQDVLVAVASLLHDCYPGDKWIEPLQPDLLGEQLVAVELNRGANELLHLVFDT